MCRVFGTDWERFRVLVSELGGSSAWLVANGYSVFRGSEMRMCVVHLTYLQPTNLIIQDIKMKRNMNLDSNALLVIDKSASILLPLSCWRFARINRTISPLRCVTRVGW